MTHTIVVTGATGLQRGATVRRLAQHGFHVRAVTRDAEKAKALTKETSKASSAASTIKRRSSASCRARTAPHAKIPVSKGRLAQTTPDLGRPPRSYRDYVRDRVKELRSIGALASRRLSA